MDASEDERNAARRGAEEKPIGSLPAPAAILQGLPDAVVIAERDGRIVFVNALAEELFGYRSNELLGRPVDVLWPERERERYTRNMRLYFDTEHPMRFSTEAWGLRRDGSEFVGEMSWGVVRTSDGPLLLAVGRDISDRLAAEARLRALAAMTESALAGTDSADLADEAVELIRTSLPVTATEVRSAGSREPMSAGSRLEMSLRLPIGTGGELLVAPEREFDNDELALVRAVANILATALARLRAEERARHDAVHDPLTGLANRILLRDRLQLALARSTWGGGDWGVVRRSRSLQADQ